MNINNVYLVHRIVTVRQKHSVQVGGIGDHQQQNSLFQDQYITRATLVVALAPHKQWTNHLLFEILG